jgi:glutamyl-tRNA reductase
VSLVLVGTNYKKVGLDLRERLARRPEAEVDFLDRLKRSFSCFEAVVLSTCNRFEVLLWRPSHARPDIPDILKMFSEIVGLPAGELEKSCYAYRRDEAARHFLRVAGGLDSMLVGEPQIIGQVREAFAIARERKTAGPYLTRLIQNSLSVARRIRQSAGIAEGHFSLGSVAAEFAEKLFGSLANKSFLVIGAGKMGTNALHRLMVGGAREILIANRDATKSQGLANTLPGAKAIAWDEIDDALTKVNVVLTCVSVKEPILTLERMERVSQRRLGWPMLMIDLGLPRNVETSVGTLPWVHLYDLDSLGRVLEEQNSFRREELERCRNLIDEAVREYDAWEQQRQVMPAIVSLRRKFHQIGEDELSRLASLDGTFTPKQWELVEKTIHRVIHKILHEPTTTLTDVARDSRAAVYAGVLRKLFDLPETPTADRQISKKVLK